MSDRQSSIIALAERLRGNADERAAAAEALAQLGTGCRSACIPLVQACGTDDVAREWASAALEEMGAPSAEFVPDLISLIDHPKTSVAYWAVTLLGRCEDQATAACDALAAAIASDRDLSVRERAVWAVDRIGCRSPIVIQTLTAASQSPHPRLARLAGEVLS